MMEKISSNNNQSTVVTPANKTAQKKSQLKTSPKGSEGASEAEQKEFAQTLSAQSQVIAKATAEAQSKAEANVQNIVAKKSVDGTDPNAPEALPKDFKDQKDPAQNAGHSLSPAQIAAAQLLAGEKQIQAQQVLGKPTSEAEKLAASSKMMTRNDLGTMGTPTPEMSPLSMKAAVGTNTGIAIAGLKPWSKDWVFEGGFDENPELKGLFDKKTPEAATSNEKSQTPAMLQAQTRGDAAMLAKQLSASSGKEISPDQLQAMLEQSRKQISDVSAAVQSNNPELLQKMSHESNADVAAALAAMNGSMEVKGAHSSQQTQQVQQRPQNSSALHSVGGAEFLSALNSVQQPNRQSLMGNGGESQQQNSQMMGGKPQLRVIEGGERAGRSKFEDDLMASSAGLSGSRVAQNQEFGNRTYAAPPAEIAGHVVQGAMAQDRLSSESILGLSAGIRNMSSTQGGGEIRLRLKPDNLGELHVRVVAQGNQVGLQIQASDEHAKKILEESVSHLKESLASHNLNLSVVDMSISQPGHASGSDLRQDLNQRQNGQGFQDWMGSGTNQSKRDQSQWGSDLNDSGSLRTRAASGTSNLSGSRSTNAAVANGRLDVQA